MSTKDEIRAALEAHGVLAGFPHTPRIRCVCGWQSEARPHAARHRDHLADVIAALLPEETETVEWGVRCDDPDCFNCPFKSPGGSPSSKKDARAMADDGTGLVRVLRRTVTTYATKRTPWEEA